LTLDISLRHDIVLSTVGYYEKIT